MSTKSNKAGSKESEKWIRQRISEIRKAVHAESKGQVVVEYSEEFELKLAIFKARMEVAKNFSKKSD